MNNYPIDAQIYVSKMMSFFETVAPQLCLDEEIENEQKQNQVKLKNAFGIPNSLAKM